jgi:rubredoxin
MSGIVQVPVATFAVTPTLPQSNGKTGAAMATILDDQAKCGQCGRSHFTVLSLTDSLPTTLTCLECGFVWVVDQPDEDDSQDGVSGGSRP